MSQAEEKHEQKSLLLHAVKVLKDGISLIPFSTNEKFSYRSSNVHFKS